MHDRNDPKRMTRCIAASIASHHIHQRSVTIVMVRTLTGTTVGSCDCVSAARPIGAESWSPGMARAQRSEWRAWRTNDATGVFACATPKSNPIATGGRATGMCVRV